MSELNEDIEGLPSDNSQNIINPVHCLDGRIANISSQLNFAVEKGANVVTCFNERAASANASGMSFNVTVPSMSSLVDRVFYLKADVTFAITANVAVAGQTVLNNLRYTVAPFPFHEMVSSMSVSINNQNISFPCFSVLPLVSRLIPQKELLEHCNMTGGAFNDYYGSYGVAETLNAVGGAPAITNFNSSFNGYSSFLPYSNKPRKSAITVIQDSAGAGANGDQATAYIGMSIYEPILMPPFLLQSLDGTNTQAMHGISTLRFQFQFGNVNCRAIRGFTRGAGGPPLVPQLGNITCSVFYVQPNATLQFQVLTPSPSQSRALKARNELPYLEFRPESTLCPLITYGGSASGAIVGNQYSQSEFTVTTVQSNNYQLAHIPDKVAIFCRRVKSAQAITDADAYLPVKSLNISFNARTGILSNANRLDLYRMTKDNGLQMSWDEFSGSASVITPASPNGSTTVVSTSGSIVLLDFARDLGLQDWEAPSSLGQYNFSVSVNVYNNIANPAAAPAPGDGIAAGTYELVCVFISSGLVINELGSSNIYTGLLSKQMVLDTTNKPFVSTSSNRRVGGSWFDSIKSALKKTKPFMPVAKQLLNSSGNANARKAADLLSAVGAGKSAGGRSAGNLSSRLY